MLLLIKHIMHGSIKRLYEEDPILVEGDQNVCRQSKIEQDKRDFLHLKDTHFVTDSAMNAIFQYVRSKRKSCIH